MKIGIIVHSQTGNTYLVAQRLQERLVKAGHTVNLDKVEPVDNKQTEPDKIKLKNVPETGNYDTLVFAAPVWAFSLSAVMSLYLRQLSALGNKKTACFVTMAFPFSWMGGNRAVAQMKKICESKGGKVCGTGVVNWMNKRREQQIDNLVEYLGGLY